MTGHQLDEERIFHTARLLPTPEAKADYLDQICAGDHLRERVEALLDVHEKEVDFLKSSPEAIPTIDHTPMTEAPGQQIGRFKLLQKIGEGGFGVVYMAEQTRPVRRKVALKIIKPGMDTHAVVARFEAERQTLAIMEHPNIARVIDGGATDSGRPYFVMELVKGVPITEYCDKNNLPTSERLELFITVCQAVQHAHQKGIIHRDLKPSNILITLADGKPVVKVIDFGVSKAINQQLTEKTLFTAYGQMIGTPQYMSPEQAEMSCLDVDTRSDIYSLGVLLYELLTGTTPLEGERLRAAGFAEMQRLIQEEEPPKPSVRLSTAGEKLTVVAKHRSVTPERLHKTVKGDLDWIVMKALEKDRGRRYDAANGLAADVDRYLRDDAVEARPPTSLYRFRKFVNRNRGLVVATTIIAVALLATVIASTTGLIFVNANRVAADEARWEAERANDRTREVLDEMTHRLYEAQIHNAMVAWKRNDLSLMRQLLGDETTARLRRWEWVYVNNLLKDDRTVHKVPTGMGAVRLSISPKGDFLAVGHPNHTLATLTDVRTSQILDTWGRQPSGTWALTFAEFSPNGDLVVTPSDDWMSVVVRDVRGNEVKRLAFDAAIRYATFSPLPQGKMAVVSDDDVITLFDSATYAEVGKIDGVDSRWGTLLKFSPDGSLLLHSGGKLIYVVDVANLRVTRKLEGHEGSVYDIDFVEQGKRIVSGGADRTIRMWDTESWEEIKRLGPLDGEIRALAYSPDRNVLAAGMRNRTVRLWRLPNFEDVGEFRGYNGLYSLDFSAHGELVFGGQDRNVIIADELVDQRSPVVCKVGTEVSEVAFSRSGKLLVAFGSRHQPKSALFLFDLSRPNVNQPRVIPIDFPAYDVVCSDTGECCVGERDAARVHVYGLVDGAVSRTLEADAAGGIFSLAFSSDGALLAGGLRSGEIIIWDFESGRVKLRTQPLYTEAVTALGFLSDNRHVVSGSGDGVLTICDSKTGSVIRREVYDGRIHELACSKSRGFAFSLFSPRSDDDRQNLVCDGIHGQIRRFRGHTFSTNGVAFLNDGETLVSAGGDRTIKLFDLGRLESRLTIEEQEIFNCVAVATDDSVIAAGTREGSVYLFFRDR